MSFLKNLTTVRFANQPTVGGKAASLGELLAHGFCVPQGFVIETHAHELYQTSGNIPEELQREIYQAFDALNIPRVAVRSSASVEDGVNAAWAGQFETFLHVSREELLDRIYKCWESVHSQRAQAYSEQTGVLEKDIAIAVIIQQMADAEVAGVAFSVHPVTGDTAQVVIECTSGLGDALVSGRVTPETYIVNKSTGSPLDTAITPGRTDALLPLLQLQNLTALIREIEQIFGFPIDVEWAFANGQFSILQARPITTL